MEIDVHLYGRLREIAGCRTVRVELPRAARDPQDLKQLIGQQRVELAPFLSTVAVCVGDELLAKGAALPPLSEVALIPPVSGG